ncbi:phosphodiester glycosidase family protein [Candidatus Oscillochloris fontis]|uniref:phosphodiester glycosidase family protein n=1 Tax=Candidatus Oscillochloris fontis TaxID=2496868 RepID=UPI00101B629A|nr:phosphodiester glycosidase family protein [Candidatus Oscillochloris fontis]
MLRPYYNAHMITALRLLIPLICVTLVACTNSGNPTVLSSWNGPTAQPTAGLVGHANPLAGVVLPAPRGLAAVTAASTPIDSAADGAVQAFRYNLPGGGTLAYVVVHLRPNIQVALVNADGATPASDAQGDTIWADGGRHLATVAQMVAAPYAARPGMELVFAMAFGFHGEPRTSDEGSVVIDGVIYRVNAGRTALCMTPEQRAMIGLFSATDLAGCSQAAGAGPVILWGGRVVSLEVEQPTAAFLPFNPLNEDFVHLDWRRTIYAGRYPKTAIGVGYLPDGTTFLVLATSEGALGEDVALALRDMGCIDALGGDDDTSTQAVWRGQSLWSRPGRPVPDAVAVYVQ